MTMRISNLSQTQAFIDQMMKQQKSLADIRNEIASGYKVSKASDSAGNAGVISSFQTLISRLKDHKDRMAYAENLMSQQEAALTNSNDLLVRAKEIATQAANETYSVEQRRSLATEVWALRQALVANANSVVLGKYVYGGTDDDDPPFDAAATGYTNPAAPPTVEANTRYVFDAEQGTANRRSVRITDGERINITTSGAFFQGAVDALERLGRALEGYRTTPELSSTTPDLGGVAYVFPGEFSDQTDAIINSIDQLETARVTIQTEQSDVGARMNRIIQAREIVDLTIENAEANRSHLQDADMTETASNLANLQTSYQALLASGAQINRLSLLDFI